MTNRQIRSWYIRQLGKIATLDREWIRRGDGIEQRARQAWAIRSAVRLVARAMMEDPVQIEELRARDAAVYGSPDGPTFDFLVAKYEREGLVGPRIFARILRAAQTTNPDVKP